MQLNLPILDRLVGCERILIAGMGGGYDVFCGVPLFLQLRQHGFEVHLANLSFVDFRTVRNIKRLSPDLIGVQGFDFRTETTATERELSGLQRALFGRFGAFVYFPELYLSQWFKSFRHEDVPVWCFNKIGTGAVQLTEAYKILVDHLSIDAIILADGGVDSLARGDEAQMGTLIEDSLSLAAVAQLDHLHTRIVACLGFGAEEHITYAHILANIADLAASNDFLGSCSLIKAMEVYQAYDELVTWVHSQAFHDPSVINASVVSAVRGHFGDFHLTHKTLGSQLWISPLMSIYWFFDALGLAKRHLFLDDFKRTQTARDTMEVISRSRKGLHVRPQQGIPL